MYDEAWERRDDPQLEVAKRRVQNILQQQVVASIRTLEAKISEAGQGTRPAPHTIYNAVRALCEPVEGAKPIVVKRRDQRWPCDMYYLASANAHDLALATAHKVGLEKRWHKTATRSDRQSIGKLGEQIVRDAFEAAPKFFVAPGWGDVRRVNGKNVPADEGRIGSVDGLVMLAKQLPRDGSAIVEVKNQREWIYPRDPALWDIIRNGFAVDAVPVLFARKIYSSAYTYVLQRVGAIGIQVHAQFVPTALKAQLEECKDRKGLGFKDLDFDETVPRNLQSAIELHRILMCWRRILIVLIDANITLICKRS